LVIAVLAAGFAAIGYQVQVAKADGTFSFASTASTVEEGDLACIQINRSTPRTEAVTLIVERTGGNAPSNDVYLGLALNATLTVDFASTDAQREIQRADSGSCIQVIDTPGDQGTRTIELTIVGFDNGTDGAIAGAPNNKHTLTITD